MSLNIVNDSKIPKGFDEFADSFSADNWTHSGSLQSISGGEFNWDSKRPGNFSYRLLPFVTSDTAFNFRLICNMNTVSAPGVTPTLKQAFGISSDNQNENVAKDMIAISAQVGTTNDWGGIAYDNQTLNLNGASLGNAPTQGTTRYLEIVRKSASLADYFIYLNSDFTGVEGSLIDQSVTNITNLQYAWIGARADAGGGPNSLIGTSDDYLLNSGTTQP